MDVPFAEKDEAKRLGARWDMAERRWYALPGREAGLSGWAPAPPYVRCYPEKTERLAPDCSWT